MFLQQAQSFWDANWLTVVTFVVGVAASWLFAWLYFKKSAQQKRLWFSRQQSPIFRKLVEDIGITYRGSPVKNPHIAEFVVWNSGNTTIRATDISANAPLKFSADDMKFLSAEITQVTKEVSNTKAIVHDNYVEIQFEYLDAGDGFAVEMVADQSPESDIIQRPDIALVGTLIGQSAPPVRVRAYLSKEQYYFVTVFNYTIRVMGTIMIGVGGYVLLFNDTAVANAISYPLKYDKFFPILFLIYRVILILMSLLLRRRRPPFALMRTDPAARGMASGLANAAVRVIGRVLLR